MAIDSAQILVVVPVYNHVATLRDVVSRCLLQHPTVLVVDDGSSDGGADVIADLDVAVLRHAVNRGKGAALLSAADYARQHGMSHIITLDADGQHFPEDLPAFVAAIGRHPLAIHVGRRDFTALNVPRSSRFGREFSNFWLKVQTGHRLGDVQSGYRAYPLIVFEHLQFTDCRYSFEVEVLVKASWAGVPLHDVDIRVYYAPGSERISHFDKWRDNLRLSWLNTRLCLRSIAPWPHKRLVKKAAAPFSWRQPIRSLRRLLAQNISPARLAMAMAVGVLLGALPLIACHTIATLFVAGFFGLNRYLAVAAGNLCMPPLVPALCIEVGHYLRHGRWLTDINLETLGAQALQRVYEWFLGSLLVGPGLAFLAGIIVYILARVLVGSRQQPVEQRAACSEQGE
jgi:glycosyltransferase involved in cell wall biosynthesis